MDEAFLDVSGSVRRLGLAVRHRRAAPRPGLRRAGDHLLGRGGRHRRRSPSSPAGGPSPTGCVVVPPAEVTTFLHPLPVEELWGVGEKTAEQLHRLGLMTVGDVAHTPLPTLQRAVGPAHGPPRCTSSRGGGPPGGRPPGGASEAEPDKSMGADETFGRDTDDPEVVLRELLRLSAKVGARMRAAQVAGRTVTLKVRFADFTTITRSRTLGGGHRRDPGDLPDRGRPVRARSGCSGPGSGWSGSGSRDWCRAPRCTASWCSVTGSTAGPRPTGRWTGRSRGSAPPRSDRPPCSAATAPETGVARPGDGSDGLRTWQRPLVREDRGPPWPDASGG